MAKTCYFNSAIGESKTPIRDWSDQVLDYIVAPVVNELEYSMPIRKDFIAASRSISTEIIRHLVEDDLVIADLTGGNPNVFYELAIRHMLQKPVVHIIRDGDNFPFDIHDVKMIPVSLKSPREVDLAKRSLKSQIVLEEEHGVTIIPSIFQFRQINLDGDGADGQKDALINLLEQFKKVRQSLGDVKSELITLNNRVGNIGS